MKIYTTRLKFFPIRYWASKKDGRYGYGVESLACLVDLVAVELDAGYAGVDGAAAVGAALFLRLLVAKGLAARHNEVLARLGAPRVETWTK